MTRFDQLNIDIGKTPNETDSQRTFENEMVCSLSVNNVNCGSYKFPMSYQIDTLHGAGQGVRRCGAGNVDLTSWENKLCQLETGKNSPSSTTTTYASWLYD